MIGMFLQDRTGATAIEYGLIAALVAVAALAGMQLTGGSVNALYGANEQKIGDAINNASD